MPWLGMPGHFNELRPKNSLRPCGLHRAPPSQAAGQRPIARNAPGGACRRGPKTAATSGKVQDQPVPRPDHQGSMSQGQYLHLCTLTSGNRAVSTIHIEYPFSLRIASFLNILLNLGTAMDGGTAATTVASSAARSLLPPSTAIIIPHRLCTTRLLQWDSARRRKTTRAE